MTILEQLDQDFKEAMKAKDEVTISTLRLARTALKNRQIEVQRVLTNEEVVAVLKTMIKQYQDAISDFTNAGRQDLVERQQKEIDILAAYLPPSLPPEEVERLVREALVAADVKEVGKAMGVAMKAVAGRADGNDVRRIVERLLAG
ncbi:GatB/YqeY domain-containing protein [Patescibacteria group bacterium]|nr:GatB/YqeY domain-containing protein [Patescibacteria group bacterium]MBP9710065.1 GatB/YqeY domain-containing protein [Patescibacteria group bacterium]